MSDGTQRPGSANDSAAEFDPYYSWLGIPPSEQPPNYYRLLGLHLFVDDADVIASASDRQMSFVKGRAAGKYQHLSQKILTELAQAKVCLLDPQAKAQYDARLRQQVEQGAAPAPVEPQAPPQTVAPPAPQKRRERFRGPAPPPPPTAEDEAELNQPVHFNRERGSIDQEMDMTPMVDVTFLLLIFFMVTAAFSLQKSIPVPKPQPDEASTQRREQDPEDDPDTVTVFVDEYNTYQITTVDWEYEAPSEQELRVKLREARLGSSGVQPTRLLVRAHGDALHEKVVTALDAGTEVGMEDVVLQTVEDE